MHQPELAYFTEKTWLEKLPPYQGGGEMIQNVSFENHLQRTSFKFEAEHLTISVLRHWRKHLNMCKIGIEKIADYENELTEYATKRLLKLTECALSAADHKAQLSRSLLVRFIHMI